MAGEAQSDYDQLFPTRVFFFVALIMLFNIVVVIAVYTFWLEKPFHIVLAAEKAAFGETLTPAMQQTMHFAGDRLYGSAFVNTGIERLAYEDLKQTGDRDIAGDVVKNLRIFGSIFDNLFDYALLLCYRAGFLVVAMTYFACLIVAIAIHGYTIRHRKRYGFGDTPLLLNLWARTTLAYAFPITFLIWTLPFALGPFALTASLACCVCGIALFSFSLPKIA